MFAHLVIGVSALSIIREEQTPIRKDLSVFSNSHFSKKCFINSDLLFTPSRFDMALFEEFSFGLFSIGGIIIVKIVQRIALIFSKELNLFSRSIFSLILSNIISGKEISVF